MEQKWMLMIVYKPSSIPKTESPNPGKCIDETIALMINSQHGKRKFMFLLDVLDGC
jgi:hypothetical protein